MDLPPATRAQRQLLASLRSAKGRAGSGLLLVEGARLLTEALAAALAPSLVAATREAAAAEGALLAAARRAGAVLVRLDPGRAPRAGDAVHGPGLLAAVRRPAGWSGDVPEGGEVLVPVLCGLQDPGNVGALLRSARAFGAPGALLLPGCADPAAPKVVRASAGAVLHLPWLVLPEAQALPGWARERELAAVAAAAPAAGGRRMRGLPGRCLLLLGHETRGLPRGLDAPLVAVPQEAAVESLNVVVAGSILMAGWYAARHGTP